MATRRKTAEEVAEEAAEVTPDGSKNSSADDFDWDAANAQLAEVAPDPQPDKETRRKPRRRKVAPGEGGKKKNTTIPGSGRRKDLTKDLTGAMGSIALPMFALSSRNPKLAYDAQVILENAEDMAKALNDLAQRNPAVYRALFYFINGSDMTAVLAASMNIAIPILREFF